MEVVILLNVIVPDSGERLARSLLVLLGQLFVVAYADGELLSCPGTPPELLLCRCAAPCRISGQTVLVAGTLPEGFVPPAGALLVAESCNAAALELAAAHSLTVLRCGFSREDTLTFSSIGEEGAVVSLSQPVRDQNGRLVEPFELPVKVSRMPIPFALLAAAAVAVVAGRGDRLAQMVF